MNKRKKRRGSVTAKIGKYLIAAMLLFVGVSVFGGGQSDKASSSKEELTVLTWRYQPNDPFWLKVVEEYKSINPNVVLTLINVADNNSMEQKASAMLAGKQPLDIIWTDSSVTQAMGKAGLLEPLTSYIKKDNFDLDSIFMSSKHDHMWNGELVGLPAIPMGYLIFYNKDIFDKAGVPYPKNDWTIDEFLDAAKKTTNASLQQFGYGTRPWIGTHDLAFVYAYGGKWFDDNGNPVINDAGTIKAYQFIQDLINTYKVAPNPSGVAGSSSQAVTFDSGKLAMNWSGTWDIRGTEGDNPKWKFKWGVVLPPKGPNGQYPIIISNGWSIINRSQHKEEAWNFLKWWNTGSVQQLLCEYGEIPSNIQIADDFSLKHLEAKDRATIFEALQKGYSRPTQYLYWARSERESNAFRDRIYQGENVKKVLDEMRSNVESIVKEYR